MAIALVNIAGTANGTPTTSLTISVPTGTSNGHFMLASMVAVGSDTEVGFFNPGGWTILQGTDSGASVGAVQYITYWRVANNEPASYTWPIGGSGVQNGGFIASFSGVDTSAGTDDSGRNDSAGPALVSTALNTSAANDWLLWIAGISSLTMTTYAVPSGFLSRYALAGAGQANLIIGTKTQAAAGAVASASATMDLAASDPWGVHFFAIKPLVTSAAGMIRGYHPEDNRKAALRRTRRPMGFTGWHNHDAPIPTLLPTPIQPWIAPMVRPKRRARLGWLDAPRPGDVASPPSPTPGPGPTPTPGPTPSPSSGGATGTGTQLPPQTSNDNAQWQRQSQAWMVNANQGHLDNAGQFTLDANANTTVIIDSRVGSSSHIGYTALTANAAAEVANGTMFVSTVGNGSFVVTHANNALTDRTFSYSILG